MLNHHYSQLMEEIFNLNMIQIVIVPLMQVLMILVLVGL